MMLSIQDMQLPRRLLRIRNFRGPCLLFVMTSMGAIKSDEGMFSVRVKTKSHNFPWSRTTDRVYFHRLQRLVANFLHWYRTLNFMLAIAFVRVSGAIGMNTEMKDALFVAKFSTEFWGKQISAEFNQRPRHQFHECYST